MCDTLVALPPATAGCGVLFAKNSDRERGEAQPLAWHPRARHAPGTTLRCTYIGIPQATETHAALLSRPFWCWGAEMGANEHGVVIGNEAVFATIPPAREPALIGMDLLRLGLERAATAAEAVEVITTLLERHGQGGDCGHRHEHHYDNAFLIADPREAYVLETIGRMWAVERVAACRAISNALSIGRGRAWRASEALLADAHARGLARDIGDLDLSTGYLDTARDAVTRGRLRCERGAALLARRAGTLDAAAMRAILRDHGVESEADPAWHPARTIGRTICMHAGAGERRGQTTASMVSELRPDGRALHWVTASAAPCPALFRPVVPGFSLPAHGPSATDRRDDAALWWRHERVHRAAVTGDFAAWLACHARERDAAETRFEARMQEALASGEDGMSAMRACWEEAATIEARWAAEAPRPMPNPDAAFLASWAEAEVEAERPSRRAPWTQA